MRTDRRAGITLLELMIALSLAGILLVALRGVLIHLADSGERTARAVRVGDGRSNGERVLRLLLRRVLVAPDSAHRFVGDVQTASFHTLCESPDGWLERCRVRLDVAHHADSSILFANAGDGRAPLRLLGRAGDAELRYADYGAADEAWVASWGTSIALPSAMVLLTARDTTVLRVGVR